VKILVTFPVLDEKLKKMEEEYFGKGNIVWYPEQADAEILLVLNDDFPYSRNIKMIQTISAGVDHLNLSRLEESTIICSNAGAYALSVAEHVFALLLSATKKIREKDAEMKKSIFRSDQTILLYKKTLGIIGYGGIGKRVAKIAKSFDMKVIALGRNDPDENVNEYVHMDKLHYLIKKSDFILICIPLTKITENIIGIEELNIIKKNGMLINVARPEIVKKDELFRFLKERRDVMYLSDVWWDEPNVKDTNIDNALLTSHIAGGKSGEIMEISFKEAFENIKRFINNETLKNVVKRDEYKKIERKNVGV
jgi:glycerate dehydrogenase